MINRYAKPTRANTLSTLAFALMLGSLGCGAGNTIAGSGGRGMSSTGGMGTVTGSGGNIAGSGGALATGGATQSSGGATATGGVTATGGATPDAGQGTGGGSGAGAGQTGGATNLGGSAGARTGGAGVGGSTRTGGNGGALATGGAGGGISQGGTSGAAGGAAGGAPAFDGASVNSIMRRVADYEISRFGTTTTNGWVRAVFHTGMLAAYRVLGDAKYVDYTRKWGQANAWLVSTVDSNGPRFADNQACFQGYSEMYLADPIASNDVMIASARTVFDSMVAAPKAGRDEWWWCDALFMAPPAMARVAKATGKTAYLDLMHKMFWDTKAFLFDPVQNLFWRDSTFRNTNTYWARGNGWTVGGTVRVLDALPTNDARRKDYEDLLRAMATKLRGIQASDGFWRSSLMEPTKFTTPESSGTAFFCYGIAWGINNGVLDRATFLPTVMKAWGALVSAVNAQGRLGWVQAVGSAPGASTMDNTNDYATGAFLLAGEQILKL